MEEGFAGLGSGLGLFRYAFSGIVMSIQLAPEVEAGLRAEAAALGISVDALIASAVRAGGVMKTV